MLPPPAAMRTFLALAVLLAACGSGSESISVKGDFASREAAPGRVYALEARVDAEVRDGSFSLDGLATSPISLRMLQNGDTVGHVDLADLPPGAGVVLHGLRTDPRSGRAFPLTVELSGAPAVRVNGIRMMNPGALPAAVDAPGVVLAASSDRSALLVRPADEQLPDLRVVVTPTTSIVTPDSLAADVRELSPGDSVHVRGPTDRGFVVTDRLVILGATPASTVSSADGVGATPTSTVSSADGVDEPRESRSVGSTGPVATPVVRASAPVARSAPAVRRGRQGGEREVGRGRGRGGGNGGGKGNKKGKG